MYGGKSLVYLDESGFESIPNGTYAWSKKGKKIYGEKQGKRGKRENLVAWLMERKKGFNCTNAVYGQLKCRGI